MSPTGSRLHGVTAFREEKGSGVNVSSLLLLDVFTGAVDGWLVSNDSDLALPVRGPGARAARAGEPGMSYIAGELKGTPTKAWADDGGSSGRAP